MTVPSYSVIIETANLSLADLDGLRETLDSLAVQTLPVQNAREVLLADSGDVPPDSLQQTLRTYPWVRPMGLAEGTGYEELKMAGANASSGELIVFADGDCLYRANMARSAARTIFRSVRFHRWWGNGYQLSWSLRTGGRNRVEFPRTRPFGQSIPVRPVPPEQRRLPPPGSAGGTDSFAPTVLSHERAACGAAARQGLHDPASALGACGACGAKRCLTLRVALPAHGVRRCGRTAPDRKGVDACRQIPGSAPSNVRLDPILGRAGHGESRGRASRQTVACTGAAPRAAHLRIRSRIGRRSARWQGSLRRSGSSTRCPTKSSRGARANAGRRPSRIHRVQRRSSRVTRLTPEDLTLLVRDPAEMLEPCEEQRMLPWICERVSGRHDGECQQHDRDAAPPQDPAPSGPPPEAS